MTVAIVREGEAASFRQRLVDVEEKVSDNSQRIAVHEAVCAGRYRIIIAMLTLSMAINIPSAWPHIATFIGLLK